MKDAGGEKRAQVDLRQRTKDDGRDALVREASSLCPLLQEPANRDGSLTKDAAKRVPTGQGGSSALPNS